jgi:hypothetical protein
MKEIKINTKRVRERNTGTKREIRRVRMRYK